MRIRRWMHLSHLARLPLPIGFSLRFSSAAHCRAAISSRARRFASIRTWEYRESMARETCPAMLMITSSPAPNSASSVTSVWRFPDRGWLHTGRSSTATASTIVADTPSMVDDSYISAAANTLFTSNAGACRSSKRPSCADSAERATFM
jgi:hypothetical protein